MIAVDTNIISAFLKRRLEALPSDKLYVPYVVIAELQAGLAAGAFTKLGQRGLDKLLADPNITLSPGLSGEVLPCYAQIYAYLKLQGTPISPNDMWIAAECMQLSFPLLTYDKDFMNVPQVKLVNIY